MAPAATSLLLGFLLAGVLGKAYPRVGLQAGQLHRANNLRIVGGNVTQQGQFPSIVSIQHRALLSTTHVCGGTILNENHVLTAAQCVKGYAETSFDIVAGEQNLDQDSGLEQTRRSQSFVTGHFTTTTGANDIAIIRTDSNFDLVEGVVEVVALPTDYQEPIDGALCTAVGWGYTSETAGDLSSDLRFVNLPFLTDTECQEVYGEDAILLDMMCAGYLGGEGVCRGDGGGPLFCDGVQQGITSWGDHCDAEPGVYTQVSHYLDWIKLNSDF